MSEHDCLGDHFKETIRSLESQLSEVRGENEKLKKSLDISYAQFGPCFETRDLWKSRADRYEKALRIISEDKRTPPLHDYESISSFFLAIRLEAKSALAPEETK